METREIVRPWRLTATALLTLLAFAAAFPAAGMAQTPYAQGVLYEVGEEVACNPGSSTVPNCAEPNGTSAEGFGVRLANATLVGGVPPFLGGILGPPEFTGAVTLTASSVLSQVDWAGPIHGKFTVVTVRGNVTGTLSGQLDLAPAILADPPVPIAPVSGRWRGTKGSLQAGGVFSGVFLIPFQIPGLPQLGFFYLEIGNDGLPTGNFVPLEAQEYANGAVPLVKLLVTLFR